LGPMRGSELLATSFISKGNTFNLLVSQLRCKKGTRNQRG
jgi:hypothetical protein